MSSDVEPGRPLDLHDVGLVLAVLDVVSKTAAARLADGKDIARDHYFRPKDRTTVVDPETGDTLGLVLMTKPSPKATITDRAALVAWARDERPDDVTEVTRLRAGAEDEAMAVIATHAPHLLDGVSWDLTEQGEAAILKAATKKNADMVPGVEVRTPRGSITTKLDDGAAERIRELVAMKKVDPMQGLPRGDD